jgi:hypothetical protein
MSDTDETTAPGYPDGFEFRLSPDQRQFAAWEPGNQPWFIPVAGMQGRFVDSGEMDALGWTRYLPLPEAPPTMRERQALLEENAYLHTVASGAENVRQAWRERAERAEASLERLRAEVGGLCECCGDNRECMARIKRELGIETEGIQ